MLDQFYTGTRCETDDKIQEAIRGLHVKPLINQFVKRVNFREIVFEKKSQTFSLIEKKKSKIDTYLKRPNLTQYRSENKKSHDDMVQRSTKRSNTDVRQEVLKIKADILNGRRSILAEIINEITPHKR